VVRDVEFQRQVAAVLLAAVGDAGFALAGSGAIREHGLTDRPTEDVDLFADSATSSEQFQAALAQGERALVDAGYQVQRLRVFPVYARLHVVDEQGAGMDVDLAINWRVDPPVTMRLGPVLSQRDAVAGKVSAAYSRAEVRDLLDLDAIRRSGRYTDGELLAMAHQDDVGFDEVMFAEQLSQVVRYEASDVAEYGVSPHALDAVKARLLGWAVTLRDPGAPATPPAPAPTATHPVPARRTGTSDEALERRRGPDPSRRNPPRHDPPGRSL
jgi:hypothetical protein